MRKRWIKIGIYFVLFIVFCAFVSSSIMTITTPKADFQQVKEKSEIIYSFTLDADVRFLSLSTVSPDRTEDVSVRITEIFVKPGDLIEEGTPLFNAELTYDFTMQLKAIDKQLEALFTQEAFLIEQNTMIKFDPESDKALLSQKFMDIRAEKSRLRTEILSDFDGFDIFIAYTDQQIIDTYKGNDDLLTQFVDACEQYNQIVDDMENQLKRGRNSDFHAMISLMDLSQQINELENKKVQLEIIADELTSFKSKQEGRVTDIYIQVDDIYSSTQPILDISKTPYPHVLIPVENIYEEPLEADNIYAISHEGEVHNFIHDGIYTDSLTGIEYVQLSSKNTAIWDDVDMQYVNRQHFTVNVTRNLGQGYAIPKKALCKDISGYYVFIAYEGYSLWKNSYFLRKQRVEVTQMGMDVVGLKSPIELYVVNWDKNIHERQRILRNIYD